MAIKIGKKSEEGSFAMYKGVGSFNVVAINPNMAQLSELTGRDINNEPEYLSKTDEGIDQLRLSFYLKTDPTSELNSGIELLTNVSFTITKEQRIGMSSGKIQVIDKYGRTAWVTPEDLSAGNIPMYSNGPANISEGYRPVFNGEEYLVNFLIDWLNIPNPANYNSKTKAWTMKPDASDSEISLNFDKLFKGDVSELASLVDLAKLYAVKVAIGIRTVMKDDKTRQYQQAFNRFFAKNAVVNFDRIQEAIDSYQNNGGGKDSEFSTLPLHENKVQATSFEGSSEDPLGPTPALPEGW